MIGLYPSHFLPLHCSLNFSHFGSISSTLAPSVPKIYQVFSYLRVLLLSVYFLGYTAKLIPSLSGKAYAYHLLRVALSNHPSQFDITCYSSHNIYILFILLIFLLDLTVCGFLFFCF